MKNIKFEYVLTIILIMVIAGVITVNPNLNEAGKQGFTALIGILGGVTGFMWGIKVPNVNVAPIEAQTVLKEINPTGPITNDIK